MLDSQLPIDPSSDADLIRMVRAGRTDAYGHLFQRHRSAASRLARQLARDPSQVDDLVAEAFLRVLDLFRAGHGPDDHFRAYLLTTMRHAAYHKTRCDHKIKLSADVDSEIGVRTDTVSVSFDDPILTQLERSLAATAFNKLPERWQLVLTSTVIHGLDAAHVARMLGLTANGVYALAYRARQALCAHYLQAHLSDSEVAGQCRATFDKLGARARDLALANTTPHILSAAGRRRVDAHLGICSCCRAHVQELAALSPRERRFHKRTGRACTSHNPLRARTAQRAESIQAAR